MTRRPFRVQGNDRPLLDIFTVGRAGPQSRLHFSRAQIEQIARTVRRTPEVMVKVTGGTSVGAVSAQRRGASSALRRQVNSVVKELKGTGTVRDPNRKRLVETRRAVVGGWMQAADTLDRHGESGLAADVRHFARSLPRVLTRPDTQLSPAGI